MCIWPWTIGVVGRKLRPRRVGSVMRNLACEGVPCELRVWKVVVVLVAGFVLEQGLRDKKK